jgi:hypothetical protein
VSSQEKIAANRRNGANSRGPRTRAGKSKASRNARRHGLAAISRRGPETFAEIEAVARAICNGASDPLLLEQAMIIAESGFVLGCVQAERIAAIERHRNSTVTALATGDLGFAQAKATLARAKLVCEMLMQTKAQSSSSEAPAVEAGTARARGAENAVPTDTTQMQSRQVRVRERDEFEAMRAAMPDLERLERYRRRALSRERRAIRRFLAIQ